MARVQKEIKRTQRHGASKDRVIQNIPQGRTHTLQVEEQQDLGHHDEEQVPVPASRPTYRDEMGSRPSGESIWRGVNHDATPLNRFGTITLNLIQTPCIGQPEINPAPIKPIESDLYKGSCPDKSTLRDLPYGKSLDWEPVMQSTCFEDGEIPVGYDEATSTSSNIEQGRSILSKVAVLYATTTNTEYGRTGTVR